MMSKFRVLTTPAQPQSLSQEAGRDRQEEGRGQGQVGGSGCWQEGKEGIHDPREKEETEGKIILLEYSKHVALTLLSDQISSSLK